MTGLESMLELFQQASGRTRADVSPQATEQSEVECCPSCGGGDFQRIGRDALDHRRSMYQCRSCRWVFFGPART